MARKKKKSEDKGGQLEHASVIPRGITDEMKDSYIDYAMSVIMSRALPDVRDGLKPVNRRILYAMNSLGLTSSAKFRKSATVVGEVMGNYHPHGDASIYSSLVQMAQDFRTRMPLVHGQGNFGNIDGDNAAAMRYCVTGDTLVPTSKGLVPIESLSPKSGENIDEQVLSMNKKVQKADKWFDSGVHPTVSVKTRRGYKVRGSGNHPILVWEKGDDGQPTFSWKLLSNVKKGDIAVLDRTGDVLWPKNKYPLLGHVPHFDNKKVQKKKLPKYLNKDLAFILGLLVAEGTVSEEKIEFCNSDKELFEEFKLRFRRVFPDCRLHHFTRQPSSYGKKEYYRAEIHSKYVITFLKSIGLEPNKSSSKDIPWSVLRSPKSVVASFLRGYFEGDGGISFSGRMTELSAVSTSSRLLDRLQIVLLRFGLVSTRRRDVHRDIEKLYIRGLESYRLFEEQIGFASERKAGKLSEAIGRLHKETSVTDFVPFISEYIRSFDSVDSFVERYNFDRYHNLEKNGSTVISKVDPSIKSEVKQMFDNLTQNHYVFDPITEVSDSDPARVYSFRVNSKCHSYVGNGFVNHNTEAKMAKISSELLRDIEKNTVNFAPNYDGSKREPTVLPASFPNILVNGTLGIAVGMATNIPPHNLGEIIDATVHLVDNKDATTEDLLQYVQGPDFPTGGVIFNKKDIHHAYASGKGGIVTRGIAEIVENKKGSPSIVISSIPFRVNKADLIIKVAGLVRDKKIEGIRDIRDESTSDIRVVIDLKGNAHPQKILNALYKHTQLEETFHFNFVALLDGVPQTINLKGMLEAFVGFRKEVVKRRTEFDLNKAKDREHILLGLKKALDHIDQIIKLIKKAKDAPTAHKNLMKEFKFSEKQATAILEMKLQKLAGLERQKIEDELKSIQKLIRELEAILKSEKKVREIIKEELEAIKESYSNERRTKVIASGVKSISVEDLIPDEEAALVLTAGGYIKRTSPNEFRKQKRGGVGVVDLDTKDEDFVTHFLKAQTHADLLFFTDKGKVYQIKMYDLPEGKRATKGKSIRNFLALEADENVTSILPMYKDIREKDMSVLMVTADGTSKRVPAENFHDVRSSGIIAIKLAKEDTLISAKFVEKDDTAVIVTKKGQAIRFKIKDIREMGRSAAGVRGIKLSKADGVVALGVIPKENEKDARLLVMGAQGYGKGTPVSEYKIQKRGGGGIKTAKISPKTGDIIGAEVLVTQEEMVAMSKKSQVIRLDTKEVPSLGRQTQGVRVMRLRSGDALASMICL